VGWTFYALRGMEENVMGASGDRMVRPASLKKGALEGKRAEAVLLTARRRVKQKRRGKSRAHVVPNVGGHVKVHPLTKTRREKKFYKGSGIIAGVKKKIVREELGSKKNYAHIGKFPIPQEGTSD